MWTYSNDEPSCDEAVLTASCAREWIIDISASKHMSPLREVFNGDKSIVRIHGVGDLSLIVDGKGGTFTS